MTTTALSIGYEIALELTRRHDVGNSHLDAGSRAWLAERIAEAIEAGQSASPTPDGVIKERGEDGRDPSGTGSREPSPSVSASGFDPSRALLQSFVRDLAAAVTARLNCRAGDGSAGQSWDDIAQVMCSWMGQGDQQMLFGDYVLSVLRARDEQPKAENLKGLSPQGASPIREAEAPASIDQIDATSGGEAPGCAIPDGWTFAASLSNADGGRWQTTLRRLADGHLVTASSVVSQDGAHTAACEMARRAPGLRLAEGCCSAVSPCSHQRRSPYTICDICQRAYNLSAPPPSQREG